MISYVGLTVITNCQSCGVASLTTVLHTTEGTAPAACKCHRATYECAHPPWPVAAGSIPYSADVTKQRVLRSPLHSCGVVCTVQVLTSPRLAEHDRADAGTVAFELDTFNQ